MGLIRMAVPDVEIVVILLPSPLAGERARVGGVLNHPHLAVVHPHPRPFPRQRGKGETGGDTREFCGRSEITANSTPSITATERKHP